VIPVYRLLSDDTGASFFDLKNNGSLIVELIQMQPPK
jgi:hypothetical protein